MTDSDSLLTDLCTICHLNPPKYRCPRCSTRTCSLPCTRRHKLWSQCTGIRDPAAYLRRSDLATESAFDRDFNFLTGIERRIERAERDAENRGVDVSAVGNYGGADLGVLGLDRQSPGQGGAGQDGDEGRKRKRDENMGGPVMGNGMGKGEAGFMRRATSAGVRVIKAPRGMSRNKGNGSRWNQRNKYLSWTVEWVAEDGEKRLRNCPETWTLAEAFDRAYPPPKEERRNDPEQAQQQQQQQQEDEAVVEKTESSSTPPEDPSMAIPSNDASNESPGTDGDKPTSHRNRYFYLHRPRTTTKQPVLIPLHPSTTLTAALNGRTVLEFPTIYVLRDLLEEQSENNNFILENDYLRTHNHSEQEVDEITTLDSDNQPLLGTVAIGNIDERKVLEVLKKDLFDTNTDPIATQ